MHISSEDFHLAARRLCRQHLIGDHGELHKHRHIFMRHYSIEGRWGQIEPLSMKEWHDALAREMVRRGYKHKSLYKQPDLRYLPLDDKAGRVHRGLTLKLLKKKCKYCRERIKEVG